MKKGKLIFTVDLEDWFQVENLRAVYPYESWSYCELRIEKNVKILLELFAKYDIKATFFVLGWIAEKIPKVIREIHELGHEIASHGYAHKLIYSQSQNEFLEDLKRSKMLLEDITGNKVFGYRAPSFSITDWAVVILKEEGFLYDSSYCPTSLHNRYGKINFQCKGPLDSEIFQFPNGLIEIPIPTINIMRLSIPWGGGAYFRLLPYYVFRLGVKRILKSSKVYTFYFHPWEIDSEQPYVKNIKLNYKLRHYWGLQKTYNKLEKLLKDFTFVSIKHYLEQCERGV